MHTYIGSRCKRGHDGTRYTSSGHCVSCQKLRAIGYYNANRAKMADQSTAWWAAHPKLQQYTQQQSGAARRGIEWLFTFESWVQFWGADFARRGRGADALCCARRGDVGPYSPANCEKIPGAKNMADSNVNRRVA